ncbi:predicted protein [Sclerotinia sclerotiorum 1980 UF-70]|uniref:Uncharacterized protein n=2 Tax=Sclerotinia sclerotiorum (strain ATCC 18683 / 1980 / Ss-1) TaxID=665079 RepID=A7F2C0_SCLS1|nr:predicted protein [Sclerotinia sclerotiorum 1980 UF-70]APA09287.1 hypothetical protein sscle_05g040570 [Sclerotinia sclerotiorum 1980 UF-70]EDN95862.1 predicted protein [Sclerotinia sclerotiorum 1980 UF-70]
MSKGKGKGTGDEEGPNDGDYHPYSGHLEQIAKGAAAIISFDDLPAPRIPEPPRTYDGHHQSDNIAQNWIIVRDKIGGVYYWTTIDFGGKPRYSLEVTREERDQQQAWQLTQPPEAGAEQWPIAEDRVSAIDPSIATHSAKDPTFIQWSKETRERLFPPKHEHYCDPTRDVQECNHVCDEQQGAVKPETAGMSIYDNRSGGQSNTRRDGGHRLGGSDQQSGSSSQQWDGGSSQSGGGHHHFEG